MVFLHPQVVYKSLWSEERYEGNYMYERERSIDPVPAAAPPDTEAEDTMETTSLPFLFPLLLL
jgi:hypothetical protein